MLCLRAPTDPEWAEAALRDVSGLLADHAHCELKAASQALSLAARHPDDIVLVCALTDLAREEIEHFQRVCRILSARGARLGAPPVDGYVAELRRAISALPPLRQVDPNVDRLLVDRLLVGALIEARSCERFKLLSEATSPALKELRFLWRELLAAEATHYRTFVDLAARANGGNREQTAVRLDEIADVEKRVVLALASRPMNVRATIHG